MERKTVVRQLIKLLPKTTALDRAIASDEQSGAELYRERLTDRAADAIDVTELAAAEEPEAGEDQ
jgi:recombinational DNA repair protein RecT